MMVVLGTAIIVVQSMLTGYNSLAQAAPKAIVDGAVVALLIGRRRRWRQLALLGPVYGLVLLGQTGVIYLPPIMTLAAACAAVAGAALSRLGRAAAIAAAAVVFELLAGAGRPLHIYFGTGGGDEPLLWLLYLLEWPLRIGGALVGVWIGLRCVAAPAAGPAPRPARPAGRRPRRAVGRIGPGLTLTIAILGCLVPMLIEPWSALAVAAGAYVLFAWLAGVRRGLLLAIGGLLWVWVFYAAASYLWHHDWARVIDLLRTVVLRFMPLTCSAAAIMTTVRPVELVRVLRRWRLSPVILLPLASALRALPPARRRLIEDLGSLRAGREWRGPLTPLLRPIIVTRALFTPQFRHFAGLLAERDAHQPVDRQQESTS
jgi:hypothetical protein